MDEFQQSGEKGGQRHAKPVKDMGASVLSRLSQKSKANGRNDTLYLQLFCQEEFLRRLALSPYARQFVLKGGLFLYYRTGYSGRVTRDMDFLACSIPDIQEHLLPILENILAVDSGNHFISFQMMGTESIALKKRYPGVGVKLLAKIKNVKIMLKADFGIGDSVYPKPQKCCIPTQLPDFESPEINTYSLESTIAEKIDAILDLLSLSSRMKDYYDIYHLAHMFNFEGQELCNALQATFERRRRDFNVSLFDHFLELANNQMVQGYWKNFERNINMSVGSFEDVIKEIGIFMKLPYEMACVKGDMRGMVWKADEFRWVDSH